jgi:TolB-like protein/Flp pilus assembly protein TadD
MAGAEEHILEAAGAVGDGLPVDWEVLEHTPMNDTERGLVAELRVLDDLHRVHRLSEATEPLDSQKPTPDTTSRTSSTDSTGPSAAGTHADTTTEPLPRMWGPMEIRGVLGAGGFGVVYRAWDPRLAAEVALKVLTRDSSVGASVIEEARLLARVRHPNIVSIYGADRWNGQVGLWMELVRGRTLKQVLKERGAFGAREAALIGLDLTRALAAVHAAGLVHRDVKPHNIMREEGGRIVLMDFGAGVEWAELTDGPMHKYAGTPLYMAPELFDRRHPTPQTDLYSLGVVLYHLVTGMYPLEGSSPADLQAAHQRGERRRLRDVRPDLPTEFVRIVERATDTDAAQRYASAGEMEADLAQFAVRDERKPGVHADDAAPAPKRPLMRAIGFGVVAVVLIALAFAVPKLRRQAPIVPPTAIRSLVVLPLRNLSGDPAQDYFVDGMTELLTADLSGVSSLRVISDTSARNYRGTQKAVPVIGHELNVDGVVEGSVTQSGHRVRVTLRVINAGTNLSLWGGSYEREASDAFQLQADIARTLVSKLSAVLTAGERQRLEQTYVANPQAQELYLRGRYLLHTLNNDRLREARTLFEQAVKIDPNYAVAWASLARCYMTLQDWGLLSPIDAKVLSTRAANEALAHDAAMFEAHLAIAEELFKFDWNWTAADDHYRQALETNPNFTLGRADYARFLAAAGKLDDALAQARIAEESDPLSGEMKRTVALMLFYQREYAESERKAAESLPLDQQLPAPHVIRGRALAGLGRFDEAIAEMQAAIKLSGHPGQLAELGRIYAVAGHRAEAEAILARVVRPSTPTQSFVAPEDAGYIQAALGLRADALASLESAVDQRSERILWLRVDPRVDSLRHEPRFEGLLQRIGGLRP